MDEKIEFKVIKSGRLDDVIAEQLDISRSQAQKRIDQGVMVNSILARKNGQSIKVGDLIEILPFKNKESLKPDLDIVPFETIYEDEDILVINKPRGLVVHPSASHYNDTLVNYLVHNYPSIKAMQNSYEPLRPGIVHRIDKDTSGLLIIAKSDKAFIALSDQISLHLVDREYICLVQGTPEYKKFKIDAPIGRDVNNRHNMAVVEDEKGKNAISHFKLINSYHNVSLLSCKLETGRTHQIRVHLSYFGLPIIGDQSYGKNTDIGTYNKGQLLHAYKISFDHPITQKKMVLYAPLDDYFKFAIRSFFTLKK